MQATRTSPQPHRGFTLIEAAVTVAVAAITLSTAIPSFGAFIEKQRLDGAAAQLAADLHFARAEAARRNEGVRLSLQTTSWGSCYVVHTGAATSCTCDAQAPAHCDGSAEAIKSVAYGNTDGVAVRGNVSSILFDPLHGTSTPTGTLELLASASGRSVRHVVNVMGRVRTCSPQGAAAVGGYSAC